MTTATVAPTVESRPGLFAEFKAFLDHYGVVGLAIAFVIGAALTTFVKAVVDDLLMPIVTLLIPSGDWKSAGTEITPGHVLKWGDLASAAINFIIIAAFVFFVAKFLLREKTVAKK